MKRLVYWAVLFSLLAILALLLAGCRREMPAESPWRVIEHVCGEGYCFGIFQHRTSGECVAVGSGGGIAVLSASSCAR